MEDSKNIAIIGAGISGLTCAHILSKKHNITLYEANDYFGGHTNTFHVTDAQGITNVDTGFIVFNDRNYPLFTKLVDELGVPYQDSEMSFSFSSEKHQLEYNGHNLKTLFGQKRNLFRPRFYFLLRDILRFHRDAKKYLATPSRMTIKEFCQGKGYHDWLWPVYLQPVIGAIWSSSPESVDDMPAQFIIQFFENHGLLSVNDLPQWRTIVGGSKSYVQALLENFSGSAIKNARVTKVSRSQEAKVKVTVNDKQQEFDAVIFACHSDTALQLIDDVRNDEVNVLSAIAYQNNEVVLHTDASIMPKKKNVWASWNYRQATDQMATLTYYMNRLQNLECNQDYFVSVNLTDDIDSEEIIKKYNYSHPVLNQSAIDAQQKFHTISGHHNTYFCGAYWSNGFHEDGVASAVRVCEQLGVAF